MSIDRNLSIAARVSPEIFERLYPRTRELLESTREPKHAYIALEVPKRLVSKGSQPTMTTGICLINVEDQPGQKYILDDLINNRKSRVVCFGNFPSHDDPNPNRQRMYRHHDEPSGINPWEGLEQYCQNQMGQIELIASEVRMYKQQLEAAKQELEQLKGAGNEQSNDGQAVARANRSAVAGSEPSNGTNAGSQGQGNAGQPGLPKTESPGRGRPNPRSN